MAELTDEQKMSEVLKFFVSRGDMNWNVAHVMESIKRARIALGQIEPLPPEPEWNLNSDQKRQLEEYDGPTTWVYALWSTNGKTFLSAFESREEVSEWYPFGEGMLLFKFEINKTTNEPTGRMERVE